MSALHYVQQESCVKTIDALSDFERHKMLTLLQKHFHNVSPQRFEKDLSEKESIILLYQEGILGGFSTLMRLQIRLNQQPITAFFSGDTIVDPRFWGYSSLSRLWSRHTFTLANEIRKRNPEHKVYWLLISSGYKTYRFLPMFYRTFYPYYQESTPPQVKGLIDTLAYCKFGNEYNPHTGIVTFQEASPLRDGVSVLNPKHLKDPHIAFFLKANPNYHLGDELVCLTELSLDNLTPAGKRMLGIKKEVFCTS